MPLRPSACVPAPQGHLGPPSPRRPPAGLGLLGPSPVEGGSGPPGAPLGEGETQRSRQGLPAPLPQPPQQWRAGLQRPGRPPPRPRAGARGGCGGSRCRPAPPRPLPAGGPRPARAPGPPGARAHLVLGPPPCFPLFCPKPARKSPPSREAPAREIAFWRLWGWAGAPQAAGRGRGPRGSGAGSNPRPPPPTRSPACLSR